MLMTMNGVPFRQILVPQSKWPIKAPYKMDGKKLTLHETDNMMSAEREINYMISNNNETSYHFAIDENEIIQGLPLDRNGWHAGDGGNGYGNRNTFAMEICRNYDRTRQTTQLLEPLAGQYDKAVANAIKAGAQLMLDQNIVANMDNIKTHNDWNGKHCPRKMRNDNQVQIVKAGIIHEYNRLKGIVIEPEPVKPTTKVDGNLTLKQVVDKTIAGGYGNIPERINNINSKTNFNYNVIQAEINKRFNVTPPAKEPVKKTREQIAQEIASGKHSYGNDPARARKLKAEGYDPKWIQARVNEILKPKQPVVKPQPKPQPTGIERKYKEKGLFYPNTTIMVSNKPDTKNREVVAKYHKGEVLEYHTVHLGNGYLWLQYDRKRNGKVFAQGYIPIRTYNNGKYGEMWGRIV